MKCQSDEKSTSEKGSITALDGKVSKVELTDKIEINENEQTFNEEKRKIEK